MTDRLKDYVNGISAAFGLTVASGEIFAKILTANDDSGRHGILIPGEAYSFFPELAIPDMNTNATSLFEVADVLRSTHSEIAYKFYERYPERRITRVTKLINRLTEGMRLIVFVRILHSDNSTGYYVDAALESDSGKFQAFVEMFFGHDVTLMPGTFVRKDIDSGQFSIDASLGELLEKFDSVREMGWIDTRRSGDTGVGYTFENLIGISENNSKEADFKGIEIKCKQKKAGKSGIGKINLFQQGPKWTKSLSGLQRLKRIGQLNTDGNYSCHSQVTANPNNLGLSLGLFDFEKRIDILKDCEELGFWTFELLQKRLMEKHNRAVFIKASTRGVGEKAQFRYEELVYCEDPSIERFLELIRTREIVFEFLLSEKNGKVRNHGYPWRLCRGELLDNLFSFQLQLRGEV